MRYFTAANVAFTAPDGRTVTVKETLPMAERALSSFEVPGGSSTALDEVATRPSAYGEGREASAHRVFDENAVEIFEARLDIGKVRRLRVPL